MIHTVSHALDVLLTYCVYNLSVIEFPTDVCMHDKTCFIQNTIKKLSQFILMLEIRSNFTLRRQDLFSQVWSHFFIT